MKLRHIKSKPSQNKTIVKIGLFENSNGTFEVWVKKSNYTLGRQVESWGYAKRGLLKNEAEKYFLSRK
jgi:hypothetical protein